MAEARLYTQYKEEIIDKLREDFDYDNIMAVPKLKKIVINTGVGDAVENTKIVDTVSENLARITGQRPVTTKAKKSISNFKVREGMPLGCKVTLRQRIMYEFLDRLINLALPRTRDFQGVPDKSFDGRGNYTLGIKEHTIFPEIDTDNVDRVHGMDITFVTSAETDEEAYALLKHFGMPFVKRK
ncbi:50S ribosomal protein L5 [Balneolaceae bacterium YR4-1]|uniref:Large ribosomal subunit protein uL5 n=1 Tax=Halalkalibaculum roseum TaxID=2709311 RepID=A0A6M1SRX3_9BACT|nr:50S ribosomal protein L5 [Halalkalibaculum roseum]NGP78171.1 50S ribosomal protein L5 [Halalkalibaculum roseum]